MNRPVNITQPDSTVITNVYNKGGLLEQVLNGEDEYISNINYNARGQRTEIYFGNNSKTAYTYNSENFRLTRLLTSKNTGSVILQDLNYTYDSVGNITEVEDDAQQTVYFDNSVIDPISTYEYDSLYRLTAATGRELTSLSAPGYSDFVNNIPNPNTGINAMQTYSHEYVYDKLGNILSDNWKDYFYDTATNRLLKHDEQGQPVYTYDAHGNMLTMPHLTNMVWDNKDQLISAGNGTVTSYYNYDAQGDRSRKIVVKPGGIVEERYYVGGYEVYRKYISNNLDKERETVHIMDDRDRFVMIDTLTVENGTTLTTPVETVRYQYSNHLGSACLELDSTASIISYEEYHPFGTTSYRSGRNEVDVSLKRYKYVGKERDEETGLYYYGARYYAAWLCRFVSVDPKFNEMPHFSPYSYCFDNPIKYIDTKGEKPKVIVTEKNGEINIRIENTLYITKKDKDKFQNFDKIIEEVNNTYLKGDSFELIDFSATGMQKDGTFKVETKKVNIEIDTKYEVVKNKREAKQKIDDAGGYGVILTALPSGERSNASNFGKYDKIRLSVNDGAFTLAHEIGHDLGFVDKYVDVQDGNYTESHPLLEHEGELMSGFGDGLNISEKVRIVQNILSYNTMGVIDILPINTKNDKPFKKGDTVKASEYDYNIKDFTGKVLDIKIVNTRNNLGRIINIP